MALRHVGLLLSVVQGLKLGIILPTLFIVLLYEHLHLLVEGRHLVGFHFIRELGRSSGGDRRERLGKRFVV